MRTYELKNCECGKGEVMLITEHNPDFDLIKEVFLENNDFDLSLDWGIKVVGGILHGRVYDGKPHIENLTAKVEIQIGPATVQDEIDITAMIIDDKYKSLVEDLEEKIMQEYRATKQNKGAV